MPTLIIYATRYGATATAARLLAEQLGDAPDIVEIDRDPLPDLSTYDTVLIGGSIRAGRIQKQIQRLCAEQRAPLLARRLGLFLCCMYEGETAARQLADAYPAELRAHATATGLFGGIFDFGKLNFIERTIVKKVAGVTTNVDKIDSAAIAEFAAAFRRA